MSSAASAIPQGFKALPLSLSQLSLSAVLKCGQSFRWGSFLLVSQAETEPSHEWRFCLKDRVVCLRQSEEALFYRTAFPQSSTSTSSPLNTKADEDEEKETLAFIRDYFQLDTDLLELYDTWSASDPVFRNLRGRFSGIRMLRQDPWECLISFICSSNNNISRISKMVQNLCTHFSPPLLTLADPVPDFLTSNPSRLPSPPNSLEDTPTISHSTSTYHPFPPPSTLSSPSISTKLRALGFGYRANFIQKTAAMLLEAHGSDEGVFDFLEGLRKAETEKAREELMKLMGVGRKVADCVLLMSLNKREVVPVDTHVYQIACKHYGMRSSSGGKTPMTPKLYDEVNTRLAKIWGSYAGWAHSVLFTADLKSFSMYGLPTPTPSLAPSPSPSRSASPTKVKVSSQTLSAMSDIEILTPPDTPSSSPLKKRKRGRAQQVDGAVGTKLATASYSRSSESVELNSHAVICKEELEVVSTPHGTLADRVKRRRRVTVKSEITKEW